MNTSLNQTSSNTNHARAPIFKGSPEIKRERIPFSTDLQRRDHEQSRYAQGWEATYEWEASDGNRDLYRITLTKRES